MSTWCGMAPISESIEINRRPEEVFAYLDDVERHGEWQEQIVDVQPQETSRWESANACGRHAAFPAAIGR